MTSQELTHPSPKETRERGSNRTPARPVVTEGAAWQALWPLEEVTASASPWWLIREAADTLPRPGAPIGSTHLEAGGEPLIQSFRSDLEVQGWAIRE